MSFGSSSPLHSPPYTRKIALKAIFLAQFKKIHYLCSRNSKTHNADAIGEPIYRIQKECLNEISEHFIVVTFKFADSLTDTSNVSQNVSQSVSQNPLTERQSLIRQRIIENNTISAQSVAEELNVNIRTIYRELKQLNIHWIGSPKSGHWEFI